MAAVNAVAAWLGAIGLVSGVISFGHDVDARLPLESAPLAGIALAVVVAIPLTTLACRAARGDARTDQEMMIAGLLIVGWIVVQLVFIRTFSWFHPAYVALGAAMVLVADRRLRTP